MNKTEILKNRLLEIRSKDWKLPEGTDAYELALESIANIGSTDPVLRDELILEVLCNMIMENILTKEQIRELLNICLSEKHLFFGLGATQDDSVFNRAFTVLIIRVIVYYHNKFGEDLLSRKEMLQVFNKFMEYLRLEKDTRGYVEAKGWAHAIAHSGDALRSFALCSYIEAEQCRELLEVMKEKVNLIDNVYINEECERLVSAAVLVIERGTLCESEIVSWIRSFRKVDRPEKFPAAHYWRENIKDFLRSLYFRLKFRKASVIFLEEIEEVLQDISSNFNSISE